MRLFLGLLALLMACSPGGNARFDGGNTGSDSSVPLTDQDADGISDADEGAATSRDTDADGIPDFQDDDSDADGIPDSVEAGDGDLATPPVDSDADGIPDFIDQDSDGNGISDLREGAGDMDGDGRHDAADLDNDDDFVPDIVELEDGTDPPLDSDGDTVPNYLDSDSDNDNILDGHEHPDDTDMDETPDWRDLDSDGDGINDIDEAGDTDLGTPPIDTDGDRVADFRDVDSDNDGLSDAAELAAGTSPVLGDTDGDGTSDLIEVAAMTNPLDGTDNPTARGDFVFVEPYEEPQTPLSDDLNFSTELRKLDIYVLIDRSGSMGGEINSVRANMQTVLNNLACPPIGTGDPADCIEDIWSGAGTVGYRGSGAAAYGNHLDLQPDPSIVGPSIPTAEPDGCCDETLHLATWSVATGESSTAAGCPASPTPPVYPSRLDCTGSPAGPTGIGYPCFREGALPVVLLATDEAPTGVYSCPGGPTVIGALNDINAKFIGIVGDRPTSNTRRDLEALATGTGAVDSTTGAALVFDGVNAAAADAIEQGIRTLANAVKVDISATAVDDPSDGVDAVAAFIDHLETLQTPEDDECTDGLMHEDTDANGTPDLYRQVLFGTPVCWRIFSRMNTTVEPTTEPQLFQATVVVTGDEVTELDTRDVYFLVPPRIVGPGVPD